MGDVVLHQESEEGARGTTHTGSGNGNGDEGRKYAEEDTGADDTSSGFHVGVGGIHEAGGGETYLIVEGYSTEVKIITQAEAWLLLGRDSHRTAYTIRGHTTMSYSPTVRHTALLIA